MTHLLLGQRFRESARARIIWLCVSGSVQVTVAHLHGPVYRDVNFYHHSVKHPTTRNTSATRGLSDSNSRLSNETLMLVNYMYDSIVWIEIEY